MYQEIGIALLVVLAAGVAMWYSRRSREKKLHRKLCSRLLGDERAADRLIEYERTLAPRESNSQLIREAIDRLERDRGR